MTEWNSEFTYITNDREIADRFAAGFTVRYIETENHDEPGMPEATFIRWDPPGIAVTARPG